MRSRVRLKTLKKFGKVLILVALAIGMTSGLLMVPIPATQQAQPPTQPQIVSQEIISGEEFLNIVATDPKMGDLLNYAKELGFVIVASAVRTKFDNGAVLLMGALVPTQTATFAETIWLVYYALGEVATAYLERIDETSVMMFDREMKVVVTKDTVIVLGPEGSLISQKVEQGRNRLMLSRILTAGSSADLGWCPGTYVDALGACLKDPLVAGLLRAFYLEKAHILIEMAAICGNPFTLWLCPVWVAAFVLNQYHIVELMAHCQHKAKDELHALPDIQITSLSTDPTSVILGTHQQVKVTLNAKVVGGTFTSLGVEFEVKIAGLGGQRKTEGFEPSDQPKTIEFSFGIPQTLQPGSYNVTAEADPDNWHCEPAENDHRGEVSKKDPANTVSTGFLVKSPTTLEIAPSSFKLKKGEEVELTATLRDIAQRPVEGMALIWGASPNLSGLNVINAKTDSNGQSKATYKFPDNAQSSVVTIKVSFPEVTHYLRSEASATGNVKKIALALAVDPPNATASVEPDSQGNPDKKTFTAILTGDGEGLPKETVNWSLEGIGSLYPYQCSTDTAGKCSTTWQSSVPTLGGPGQTTKVTASFTPQNPIFYDPESVQASATIYFYPVALFKVETQEGERVVGKEIAFNASESYDPDGGSITQYSWDFGDNSTSTEQNPKHTYSQAGSYTVTLNVTDDEGVTDQTPTKRDIIILTEVTLNVKAVCVKELGEPGQEISGLKIKLSQLPQGAQETIEVPWSKSYPQNTTIELEAPPEAVCPTRAAPPPPAPPVEKGAFEYWVVQVGGITQIIAPKQLTTTVILSEDATATAVYKLKALPDLIVSSMTWKPDPPYVGDTVHFNIVIKNQGQQKAYLTDVKLSLYKKDPAKTTLIGEWIFLGELDVGEETSIAIDASPELTMVPGFYDVIAFVDSKDIIAESNEENNKLTKKIQILEKKKEPPVADADGPYEYLCDPYVITCKGTIVLDGSGSYDPDGTIVRYCWDFGDGEGICSQSPVVSHEYWEGTYTACLTVTDNDGAESRPDCATVVVKRKEPV